MKRFISLLLCMVMTVGFFGTAVSAAQNKVGLTKTSITLAAGEKTTLRLSGASGKTTWKITDASVCTYKKGTVTALDEGTAYIYATNSGKTYKCKVTVTSEKTESLSYDLDSFDKVFAIEDGKTVKVKVNAEEMSNIKVRNVDPNIIKVTCGKLSNGSFTLSAKAVGTGVAKVIIYNGSSRSVYLTLGFVTGSENMTDAQAEDAVLSSDEFADEVIRLVNEERAAAGLSALEKSDSLCSDAKLRAEEVSTEFSHTRPNGEACFTAISESYMWAGENIAQGQTTPSEVMDNWMHSAGHRANILSSNFGHIGVGYDEASDSWVQIFTD